MANRRPAVRAVPEPPSIRRRISRIKESGIRVIANATMGRDDVIPLWFGESDQPTPDFICEAAAAALRAGDTFYAPNRGKPELVTTIAEYENRLYAPAHYRRPNRGDLRRHERPDDQRRTAGGSRR